MDILIQSVLKQAQRLRLAMHVRYYDAPERPRSSSAAPREIVPPVDRVGASNSNPTSYVIIHRPYQYLEPVVRQLFRQAADVQILVDRRWHERRAGAPAPAEAEERRAPRERRVSAPMLDILINVSP